MVDASAATWQKKLAAKRAREAAEKAAAAPVSTDDYADLIPEEQYDRSDGDRALDEAVARIDILDAYKRWCAKMTPKVHRGQRENIMVSCPVPGHVDKNPSAAINLDKQVWACYGCGTGGDAHDLAAYHYGFDVPGYKVGKEFHKLRIKMAQDFGFRIETAPGGVTYVIAPEAEDEVAPPAPKLALVTAPEPVVEPTMDPEDFEEAVVPVLEMFDDGDLPQYDYPKLNWRDIVPADSFLDIYMRQCVVDDVAEEYHFWDGLLALGFAGGRRARLYDLKPVYPNMFICILGHSGSGKSKAAGHLKKLLSAALPHDWTDPSSRGVRNIASPGSAEVMIHQFQKPVEDPSNPKKVMYLAPVSGLIDFNELSSLMARAGRMGSAIKPTLMQFYDMDDSVSTSSMTTGVKEAHEPFASALTTTQPAALRTLVSKTDDESGFLNRWVFVAGPDKKKIAIGGARIDVTPAVAPLQRILAWTGTLGDDDFIELGPEGLEKFEKFFHEVLEPRKRMGGSALLSRIDLLMKKIILLLAINKRERVVSGKTVDEAISMYEYIVKCYAMPEKELGRTLSSEVADAVAYQAKKFTEKNGKGVSIRDLTRALSRRNYPKEVLIKTLDQLVKLEMIEIVTMTPGAAGGRPTVRYRHVG